MRVREVVAEGLARSSCVVEIDRWSLVLDPPHFPSPDTWATAFELHGGR